MVRIANKGIPSPLFRVAIDENNNTYIFNSYSSTRSKKDIANLNAVIKKEKIKLYLADRNSIEHYINCILLLIGNHTKLTGSVNKFVDQMLSFLKDRPADYLEGFEMYRNFVKPFSVEKRDREDRLIFFSCALVGYLIKWDLHVMPNGEVLYCKIEEFRVGEKSQLKQTELEIKPENSKKNSCIEWGE